MGTVREVNEMSRYIDTDAMKEWIDEYVSVFKKSDNKDIKGYIEHQPTIEAVPKDFHDKTCEAMAKRHQEEIANMVSVVRCKECKWWIVAMDENNSDEDYLKCSMDKWPDADDFCSYGERKATEITTDCSWK